MRTEWTPNHVAPNERELERVKREERRFAMQTRAERRIRDREASESRDRGLHRGGQW